MFKPGDVVLGAFATQDGKVLKHYSVVLTGNKDGALLVYTTSLKAPSGAPQVFTSVDMRLANWTKPCRWDASCVSLVPNTELQKTGTVSKETLTRILASYGKACAQRTLSVARLTEVGEVVPV